MKIRLNQFVSSFSTFPKRYVILLSFSNVLRVLNREWYLKHYILSRTYKEKLIHFSSDFSFPVTPYSWSYLFFWYMWYIGLRGIYRMTIDSEEPQKTAQMCVALFPAHTSQYHVKDTLLRSLNHGCATLYLSLSLSKGHVTFFKFWYHLYICFLFFLVFYSFVLGFEEAETTVIKGIYYHP